MVLNSSEDSTFRSMPMRRKSNTRFYAIATKQDFGAYLPHYIDCAFNWKPVYGSLKWSFLRGSRVYNTPGHTPGTLSMKADLGNNESFLFTSDAPCFSKRTISMNRPTGWLTRDMGSWWKSLSKIKGIAQAHNCNVVLGHDGDIFKEYADKGVWGGVIPSRGVTFAGHPEVSGHKLILPLHAICVLILPLHDSSPSHCRFHVPLDGTVHAIERAEHIIHLCTSGRQSVASPWTRDKKSAQCAWAWRGECSAHGE